MRGSRSVRNGYRSSRSETTNRLSTNGFPCSQRKGKGWQLGKQACDRVSVMSFSVRTQVPLGGTVRNSSWTQEIASDLVIPKENPQTTHRFCPATFELSFSGFLQRKWFFHWRNRASEFAKWSAWIHPNALIWTSLRH